MNYKQGGIVVSENELDSSVIDYDVIERPKGYLKQLQWDMAIGLQEVDNLTPSSTLEELLEKNVAGLMTVEEVKEKLKYY